MTQLPRTGLRGEERVVVGPEHVITFADDRMPAVLATPWLVAFLEAAARRAIADCLEDRERSVGTFLEIEHLAPAPAGSLVVCRARVIHVQGPVVTFQIEARDETEILARGLHRRRIIDVDRFRRRVERKGRSPG
jgi:predicted thioesterase